jgi:hypothetical protein
LISRLNEKKGKSQKIGDEKNLGNRHFQEKPPNPKGKGGEIKIYFNYQPVTVGTSSAEADAIH